MSALPGCTPPLVRASESDPPQLRAIRERYEYIVHVANTDPNITWHSNWTGNMFVNGLKGQHRGLCFEWQDYVYRGVEPTVKRVGWSCTGLVSNEGNGFEHHCVLVWDPKRFRQEDILPAPIELPSPPRQVYVLDAWHEGTPNIHWLDEWLKNESPHRAPARLQTLPEMTEPAAPIPPEGGQMHAPEGWQRPVPNAGSLNSPTPARR